MTNSREETEKVSRRTFIKRTAGTVLSLSALSTYTARPQSTVKLGVVWPLGENRLGNEMRKAADYATEMVNSERPLDYPERIPGWSGIPSLDGSNLELVYADHSFDPEKGAQAVKDLKDKGAVGILGALNSQVTLKASEAAADLNLPMITSSAMLSPLTKRGIDSFFRICSDNVQGAKSLFAALSNFKSDLSGEEEAMLPQNYTYISYEYTGIEDDLETIRGFAEDGVEGEFEGSFNFNSLVIENGTQLGTVVEKIKSLNLGRNDAIISLLPSNVDVFLTKQLADEYPNSEERPGVVFVDPHQRTLQGLVSELSDEQFRGWRWTLSNVHFFPGVFNADANFAGDLIGKFRDDFKSEVGNPNPLSALGFTGVHTWASIIDEAGSTKPSSLVEAGKNISLIDIMPTNWNGIRFGETDFGDKNANIDVIPGTARPDGNANLEIVELPGGFTPSSAYVNLNIQTNYSCLMNCVSIGVETSVTQLQSIREETVNNHAQYEWDSHDSSYSSSETNVETDVSTEVSNSASLL